MKQIYILVFSLCFSIAAQSQIAYLKANLQGSQEVPPNASTASGVVIVKYSMTTRLLELVGDYQNLIANANASHIHSPAPVGVNAPVLINLVNTGGTTGTLNGTATLTAAQETDLLAGNMYVNIHNTTFPGGEIRGQLTTTTSGQTEFLTARIQSAQEVPPNGSPASGSATALLDKTTGMLYLTGSFTRLTARANAAHIHRAPPNVNAPVFLNLSFSPDTTGTIHVVAAIAPADQLLMTNGNTYINIHDSIYPGGEIRGQLITQSQMVYLKATLQGSQEVPPNSSTASGIAIVKYNTTSKLLELTGNYQNITQAITASHIHSPAPVGVNAPILINLNNTGGTSGVLSGTATLTAAQQTDLLGGSMYVNVHNSTFPGGEIRGQLTTTTAGSETQYLTGLFTGSQEVPANSSNATGNVTVLLDNITNEVYVTGNFSGLTTNANAAHIHGGSAGINGTIRVNLPPTANTSGTFSGSGTVSNSFADSMILGQSYANIHNSTFPGGEIRAQLGNLVLPVQLSYFNGYKQNNKIALIWESAAELNLKQYEIEQQSRENGIWINKAVISAKGGNNITKYSYLDEPIDNRTSFVFYRLKMTDLDGRFSYSPVIKINYKESKAELTIAVNPVANGPLRYMLTGLPTNKKVHVSILDYSGRVVLVTTASSLLNNNINVANLASGIYRLILRVDENILQKTFNK